MAYDSIFYAGLFSWAFPKEFRSSTSAHYAAGMLATLCVQERRLKLGDVRDRSTCVVLQT